MTNTRIRPVTLNDIHALQKVIDATSLFPSDLLPDMMAGYFAGEESGHWLTCGDGEATAVVYCVPEQMTTGTWNALLLAVHPDYQGKGIGAALMKRVEQILTARGERILLVETSGSTAFKKTRAFYQKIGYEQEACIREFYAAGEDKIIFRKALQRLNL